MQILEISQEVVEAFCQITSIFPEQSDETTEFKKNVEASDFAYKIVDEDELRVFNKAYFTRNLLKALIAFFALRDEVRKDDVIDFGSGIGTASIALSLLFPNEVRRFRLIDKSTSQIDCAGNVFKKIGLNHKIEFEVTDTFPKLSDKSCLSIFSYVLCEIDCEDDLYAKISENIPNRAVFIDYQRTLLDFIYTNGSDFSSVEYSSAIYCIPKNIVQFFGQNFIRASFLYVNR